MDTPVVDLTALSALHQAFELRYRWDRAARHRNLAVRVTFKAAPVAFKVAHGLKGWGSEPESFALAG